MLKDQNGRAYDLLARLPIEIVQLFHSTLHARLIFSHFSLTKYRVEQGMIMILSLRNCKEILKNNLSVMSSILHSIYLADVWWVSSNFFFLYAFDSNSWTLMKTKIHSTIL